MELTGSSVEFRAGQPRDPRDSQQQVLTGSGA
jgi:hypothetical protein